MKLESLNHVGVRSLGKNRSKRFYVDVLGLVSHPTKDNWLHAADGRFSIHLMPGKQETRADDEVDLARHFALESDDLEGVVDGLLAAGLKPFQADLTAAKRKELADSSDLTFGIGTVFVWDPDDNLVEFVDPARGLFPEVLKAALGG